MIDQAPSRREFWNSRANLGLAAGTNDLGLKTLEMQHISALLEGCDSVLDAGLGNGVTAVSVLRQYPQLTVYGFDYSEAMVQEARRLSIREGVDDRLKVSVGNLTSPPFSPGSFDAAYTERSLINLDSAAEQQRAIAALAGIVRPFGRLILCESFREGLDEINTYRNAIGLDPIVEPWHNHYLSLTDLEANLPDSLEVQEVSNFSSTYYFLSRVINAWQSRCDGRDPSYDAPINKLAQSLPSLEVCAQTKLVILRKRG